MADENEKVEAPEPKHEDTPLGFKRDSVPGQSDSTVLGQNGQFAPPVFETYPAT